MFLHRTYINWVFIRVPIQLKHLTVWVKKWNLILILNWKQWDWEVKMPKFSFAACSQRAECGWTLCCMIALLIHFTTRVKSADFPGRQILINAKSRTPGSLTLSWHCAFFRNQNSHTRRTSRGNWVFWLSKKFPASLEFGARSTVCRHAAEVHDSDAAAHNIYARYLGNNLFVLLQPAKHENHASSAHSTIQIMQMPRAYGHNSITARTIGAVEKETNNNNILRCEHFSP